MGLVSSVVGATTGITATKIAVYANMAVVILGGITYFEIKEKADNAKIATLSSQMQTLETSVTDLKTDNDADKKQIAADQTNVLQIQSEMVAIAKSDRDSNSVLNKLIQTDTDPTKLNTDVNIRNSTISQQKFIDDQNKQIDCQFQSMNNGIAGSCVNGVFQAYSGIRKPKFSVKKGTN